MSSIAIVGAGPGSPDLLTLRAAELIKHAEVLVWADSLVSPEIAAIAPKKLRENKNQFFNIRRNSPYSYRESKRREKGCSIT